MASQASNFIGTKCSSRLKERVGSACKQARITKSEIIRVSVEELLSAYDTPKRLREVALKWRRIHIEDESK